MCCDVGKGRSRVVEMGWNRDVEKSVSCDVKKGRSRDME
jgi:hypothetical protein